jgi:ribonuclease PH
MKNDVRRSISVNQVKMRQLTCDITAATSAISGFDKLQIKEVIKNGAGDFTIILKRPFNKENVNKARAMVAPMSAGVTWHLAASDHDRVNVVLSSDVDFTVTIMGCDHRFNY